MKTHFFNSARLPGGLQRLTGALKTIFWTACLTGLMVTTASATTRNWTGANSGNWSDPNNWSPSGTPGTNDILYFGYVSDNHRTMNNDISGLSVQRLYFQANYYTLNGNQLAFNSVSNAPGILGDDQGHTANSFTVNINCPLLFPAGGYIEAVTGDGIISESTEQLNLNGPIETDDVFSDQVALEFLAGALGSSSVGGGNGKIYVNAPISGTGAVSAFSLEESINGDDGLVEFEGTPGNTFSQPLFISTEGSAQVIFAKSSGTAAPNGVSVENIFTAAPVNLVIAGTGNQIGANSPLVIDGGSYLSLSGLNVTVGTVTVYTGGTLDTGNTLLGINGGIVAENHFNFDHPIIMGKINLNGFEPVTVTGSETPGLEIAANIEGNGFQKLGNNVLMLSGNNTFIGDCEISAGTVQPMTPTAFGQSGPPYTYGVELDGGKLQMQNLTITNEPLFVNTSNSLFETLNQCTWTGPITLNDTLNLLAIDLTSSGLATSLTGPISGNGGINFMPLVLFNSGTVVLGGGAANTFTGPVNVQSPLVEFSKPLGFYAFNGPLTVGSTSGPACEARWLSSYQNANDPDVTVNGLGVVNLNNHAQNFNNVTFNGGTVTTGGSGQLGIYGTVTANPASVIAAMSGNLVLPSIYNVIFDVEPSALDPALNVVAQISGPAQYFVKQGGGVMALTGANTFAGTTLHEGGILDINNSSALSTGSIVIFGGNAATLRCSGSSTLNQGLELYGDGVGGTNGAIDVLPGVSLTLNGNELLDTETTYNVGAGGSLWLGGALSGTGPLTKTGTGSLVFYNALNNTYTGDTLIKEGSALLGKTFGAISVPYNLVIGTKNSSVNNNGTTATVTNYGAFELNGPDLTVNGGSLYNINGYEEHILSLHLNNGGSVQTGAGALGFNGSFLGNTIDVNPGQGGASVIAGNLYFYSGGNGIFSVGSRSQFAPGAPPELDLQAVVSDTFSDTLTKSGPGELRLTAANTITPGVYVNDGKLTLKNSSALGNNSSIVNVYSNAVLALDGGINIANRVLYLNSSNSVGAVRTVSGSNTWGSIVTLAQTAVVDVEPANGYLNLQSAVDGSGGITAIGPGTLQLTGTAANSYSGVTTVAAGTIEASHTGSISIPGDLVIGDDSTSTVMADAHSTRGQQMNPTANVTIHKSGLLDLTALPNLAQVVQTLRTITGYGQLSVSNNSLCIISNDVPCSYYGNITGFGEVDKYGAGTFTTWGDFNMNAGGSMEVFGGTWRFEGVRHNGGIIVGSGGRLSGDGASDQFVSVNSGGTFAVDSRYPDHQGSNFRMASFYMYPSSILQLDMFGPSPTGGNDELLAGSVLNGLSGGTLVTSFSYPPHDGDVITLIKVTNGPSYTAFPNFMAGVVTKVGAIPVLPSYTGGSGGHDFTLTVTNLALGYVGYELAEGNGNQTVEPNECNLLYVSLANRRAVSVTITNAFLRAQNASGVLVTIPVATFPTIAAGQSVSNSVPFQFRTDSNLSCGGVVSFELVLGVVNEGQFAINFSPVSGNDCSHPTGPCDSCNVVAGSFTTNTSTTTQPLYFVGAPSLCYPPKAYPGTNPAPLIAATPFLTHSFTNATTNALGITAQLNFNCPGASTNALGVAAYLGTFDANNPANGYLGDIGQGGPPYPAFSFQVPPGTNFTVVVMAQTNLACNSYSLELFGLPCAPPVLAIQPEASPAKVRVNWSSAYPGYTAQQSGRLIGGTFTNVPQSPVILNSRYSLTNLPATSNGFFRLRN